MNIEINDCKRWAHKLSNQILDELRAANWLSLKASPSLWTSVSPVFMHYVLVDDGIDVYDKMAVAEEVVNRWCAFIRSSCDPNLPDERHDIIFDKCAHFSGHMGEVLNAEIPKALDVYLNHTVEVTQTKTPQTKP